MTTRITDKQEIKTAIDNCIFTIKDGQLQVLLIKMKEKFPNTWALPGGLISDKETLDQAAMRILSEQNNIKNIYLEQLYTFSDLKRDPFRRVISTAYFALIPPLPLKLKPTSKYTDIAWHPYKSLGKMPYDQNKIAHYAKQRLDWKITYTNVVWSLLPPKFTLTDLQRVYEIILEKPLDKRNFRKKIIALDLIVSLEEKKIGQANRPARLYKFKTKQPKIVEIM